MRYSEDHKAKTRQRIIEEAALRFRRDGVGATGLQPLMKALGLTHGGFYAHFPSRDALLVEALAHAGQQSAERLSQGNAQREARGASPFRALIDSYLSDRHLSGTENGCAVAALVSEMPRQSAEVRGAAVERVRSLVALVAQTLPADAAPDSAAAIASQMVGALQLARALGDNAEGRALLAANRSALLARYDTSQPAA